MKAITGITLFICVNGLFIFFQVHKQNQIVKVQHDIQHKQEQLATIKKNIEKKRLELHKHKHPATIKQYSKDKMNMVPIKVRELKKL